VSLAEKDEKSKKEIARMHIAKKDFM